VVPTPPHKEKKGGNGSEQSGEGGGRAFVDFLASFLKERTKEKFSPTPIFTRKLLIFTPNF